VPESPPFGASNDEMLTWCEANVLRVHTKWGTFPPLSRWSVFRHGFAFALLGGKVRSTLNRLNVLGAAFLKQLSRAPKISVRGVIRAGFRAIRQLIRFLGLIFLGLMDVNGWTRAVRRCRLVLLPLRLIQGGLRLALQYLSPLPKIHTNGCGDFTLLSREAWFRLAGYPELPVWSMHIDSLLCYMAAASGIIEKVLKPPRRIFHLEHENSWVVLSADDRLRTFATKPWLDLGLLAELWSNMYCSGKPVKFNTTNWGLADRTLDEVWIERGEKKMIKFGSSKLAPTGS
jgi:hypothetical protein